jgi:hypothetical protein
VRGDRPASGSDAIHCVIPAQAGTQLHCRCVGRWVPAFAGMTPVVKAQYVNSSPGGRGRWLQDYSGR